jgi:hypothetical protein
VWLPALCWEQTRAPAAGRSLDLASSQLLQSCPQCSAVLPVEAAAKAQCMFVGIPVPDQRCCV